MSSIVEKAKSGRDFASHGMSELGGSEFQGTELPRHVPGGFEGITEDLDRQSRDWTMLVRLIEQQRMQLEMTEQERLRLFDLLEAALPKLRETGRALDGAVERTKQGDVTSNLSARFAEHLRDLDDLDNVGRALSANLLRLRSNWEQYARSVLSAQKMREKIRG